MLRRVSFSVLSRALNKGNGQFAVAVRQMQSLQGNTLTNVKSVNPMLSGLISHKLGVPTVPLKIQDPGRKSLIVSILDVPTKPGIVYNDISPDVSNAVQDPSDVIEKQAARMIVIRRRKMKRHRLKKLRKRMKFEWAKIRQRREMRKEKAFQAELMSQIKQAKKFDPQSYVEEKLRKANEVLVPTRWRGKAYPDFIITELMTRKQNKADNKLERQLRRKHVDLDPSNYKY